MPPDDGKPLFFLRAEKVICLGPCVLSASPADKNYEAGGDVEVISVFSQMDKHERRLLFF